MKPDRTPSLRLAAGRRGALAAGLIAGLGAPALGQGLDISALIAEGADAVPACVTCHGAEGLGDADIGSPMIAGMDAGYIRRTLAAYADGTRVGYAMNGIAPELSAEQIEALAAHYAAMPAARKDWAADATAAASGASVASDGIVAAGVPGCVSCHGRNGEGVGALFPRLAGQSPGYMAARIELWSTGEDPAGTPAEAIMARIAAAAPPEAMAAAIAYFATLDPAAGPSLGYAALDTEWAAQTYRTKPPPAEIPWAEAAAAYAAQEKRLADPNLYEHTPPAASAIPDGPLGDMIRLGRDVFVNTQALRGAFVGNDLACSNCHMNAGANPLAAPIWATAVDFPIYRGKNQHVNTLAERIAGCFKYSMDGTAPPAQHKVMVALESYMRWLATGAPLGAVQKARGYVALPAPALTPDYARGGAVYEARCAMCHGTDGAGLRQGARVVFPPVWGAGSFNWGAGMHQIDKAAGFLKANMPLGDPDLTEQQAWDVALYIDAHERPQDPRWLGSVEATRAAYHADLSAYGLTMPEGLMGDTGAPLAKPAPQPWANWGGARKPAE